MARTMVLFELEKQCRLTCKGNVGLGDVLRACFKGERLCAAFSADQYTRGLSSTPSVTFTYAATIVLRTSFSGECR
jgi:hypothetical protein